MELYSDLKQRFIKMTQEHEVFEEPITVISAKTLSAEEAIGKPDREDFPLLKGKEVMVEATFRGEKGHAYTDMPGNFKGSIKDVLALPLTNSFQRAVFVASLNAVMRSLGYITNTVHCRDKEPTECANQLPEFIKKFALDPKIAFIGYQPALVDKLSKSFRIRVIDLDKDNIGKEKSGVIIEGPEKTDEVLLWSDIIMATGSTSVNGTVTKFLTEKPVIFYGVTIAGIAQIYGYERFCPCAR